MKPPLSKTVVALGPRALASPKAIKPSTRRSHRTQRPAASTRKASPGLFASIAAPRIAAPARDDGRASRTTAVVEVGAWREAHDKEGGEVDPSGMLAARSLAQTWPGAHGAILRYPGEAHYFAEHDQQAAALLHRRALDFLQALVER